MVSYFYRSTPTTITFDVEVSILNFFWIFLENKAPTIESNSRVSIMLKLFVVTKWSQDLSNEHNSITALSSSSILHVYKQIDTLKYWKDLDDQQF